MTTYGNTNKGLLARNDKGDNEARPDLKGSINIEGKEYWLSAWQRVGQSGKLEGKKFLSITATPKDEQSAPAPKAKAAAPAEDDDIPF
jgi:hypothetical protein